MLDLRFPDSPPLASSSPGEVISLTAEPFNPYSASPSQPELGPAAFGLEVSAPLDAGVSGQRSQYDEGGAAAAVDIPVEIVPVEISPIFSALDAAERDAETARQHEPAPEPETFDSEILLPRSQWSEIEEEPVAPAVSPQATEPATDPSEFEGDAGSTTEVAASSETPQEQDAPPHADEQAPPSEILQDAAARIAAEASATAAALENLKRLLVDNRPEPEIAVLHNLLEASPERTEPPPIPVYRPPARLPITPPPMVEPPQATASLAPFPDDDDLPPRRPVAAVGSFFAGFALSWVLGAVLYVLLTAG